MPGPRNQRLPGRVSRPDNPSNEICRFLCADILPAAHSMRRSSLFHSGRPALQGHQMRFLSHFWQLARPLLSQRRMQEATTVSSLVVRLSNDPHLASQALERLRSDQRLELGPLEGNHLPLVLEAKGTAASDAALESLSQVPGVLFVDVVRVDFLDD